MHELTPLHFSKFWQKIQIKDGPTTLYFSKILAKNSNNKWRNPLHYLQILAEKHKAWTNPFTIFQILAQN